MDKIGVISETDAVMVHDHWPAYYSYRNKTHALCNAHHIRELEAAKSKTRNRIERLNG